MRTKQPTDTREAILLAAARLFAEHGYPNAPIGKLSAAAGVTKPTVYYHFGNKAGLFQAVLDRAQDQVFAMMREAAESGPFWEGRLVDLLEAIFSFTHSHTDLVRVAFYATFTAPLELPRDVEILPKSTRNFELFHAVVQEGHNNGGLNGHDSMELALHLYGQVVIHVMSYLVAPERPLDRELAKRIVHLFLAGARA